MARATTSLPVPLSPVISTVASVGATISISSHHLLHGRALADQLRGRGSFLQVLAQPHHFAPRALVLQGVGHQVRQLVGIHRLGDVVVGAALERLHGGFHRGVAGHDDDGQVRIGLLQARLQLHAVHARHFDIEQRDVELRCWMDLQRLARAAHRLGRDSPRW